MPLTGNTMTLAGIPVVVATDSDKNYLIVEKEDESGPEAQVTFLTDWGSRYTFVRAMLGTAVSVGGTVARVFPTAYPPSPNLLAVAVNSIRGLRPTGGGSAWPTFDQAAVEVVFRRPTWQMPGEAVTDESGKAMTTTRVQSSGEVFTPPGGAYYFETSHNPVEEAAVGVMRGRLEITITRHMMPPGIMIPIMAAAQNKVNASVLTIGRYDFPAGHVLCAASSSEINADSNGNVTQEFTITLLANTDQPWNKFMTGDSATPWDYINTKSDNTGDRPFAELDYFDSFFPDV